MERSAAGAVAAPRRPPEDGPAGAARTSDEYPDDAECAIPSARTAVSSASRMWNVRARAMLIPPKSSGSRAWVLAESGR